MNIQRLFHVFLVLSFFFLCVQSASIYDVLKGDSRFTTLVQQIDLYSSVKSILSNSSGQYTLFAPINSAFQPTPDLNNIESRLHYSIVDGVFNISKFEDGQLLFTKLYVSDIGGRLPVRITTNDTATYVQWSQLNLNNTLMADNGHIYPLSVLYHIPATTSAVLSEVSQFKSFNDLVSKAGLSSQFGGSNTTIFLPSNMAFNRTYNGTDLTSLSASQLSQLLRGHLVQGTYYASNFTGNSTSVVTVANTTLSITKGPNGTLYVGDSAIIYSNLLTRTGAVHVIDSIILSSIDNQNDTSSLTVRETLLQLNATAFVRAVDSAGLGDHLNTTSSVTVFAPVNSALAGITLSPQALRAALRYHLSPDSFTFSSLNGNRSTVVDSYLNLTTLAGATQKLRVFRSDMRGALVNNVTVVRSDVVASNGVVHLISHVLPPPSNLTQVLLKAGGFSRFIQLVTAAGFENMTVMGETLFVPDDSAFEHLPELENLLMSDSPDAWQLAQLQKAILHHILPSLVYDARNSSGRFTTFNNDTLDVYRLGDDLYVSNTFGADALVLESNILAAEGVVHRIDHLLITKITLNRTIDAVLSSMPSFSQFTSALSSADLLSPLSGAGPFTVIAIADDTFPSSLNESAARYHVLDGTVDLWTNQNGLLPSRLTLASLGGYAQRLKLSKTYAGVFANGLTQLEPGVEASNGYIFISHGPVPLPSDVDALVRSVPDFDAFAEAIDRYESSVANGTVSVRGVLRLLSRVTVFAPSSVAFDRVSPQLSKYLSSSAGSNDLGLIINHHIYVEPSQSNSSTRYSDVFGNSNSSLMMRSQESVSVRRSQVANSSDDVFTVGAAYVTGPDMIASNGVVHSIDRLLIPTTFKFTLDKALSSVDDARLVVTAIKGTGLAAILTSADSHVLFVPNNAAFNAFNSNNTGTTSDVNAVLQLHIVDGSQTLEENKGLSPRTSGYVLVGGADSQSVLLLNTTYFNSVQSRNGTFIDYRSGALAYANVLDLIEADNGKAYLIDRVLSPPAGSPPVVVEGSGMSGLTILIIVLIIVAILAAVGFYLYRKRKLAQTERLLD